MRAFIMTVQLLYIVTASTDGIQIIKPNQIRTPLPPFHMSKQRRISSHVYHIGIAFQSGHERSFH